MPNKKSSSASAAKPKKNRKGKGKDKPKEDEHDFSIKSLLPFHKNHDEEFTLANAKQPGDLRYAESLFYSNLDQFEGYRNYFKNYDTEIAREIQTKANGKNKAKFRDYITKTFGPLEHPTKCRKQDLVDICITSACVSKYGLEFLEKKYKRGKLDKLSNPALTTENLRKPGEQNKCRDKSNAANKKQMQAAHYLGLEVMQKLNDTLDPEHRVGLEPLRTILNTPSNLRLVQARTNLVFHKEVDSMLVEAGVNGEKPEVNSKQYDRLVQVAKRAQAQTFQDAMIDANGHYLYAKLRDTFKQFDVGTREPVWKTKQDCKELKYPRLYHGRIRKKKKKDEEEEEEEKGKGGPKVKLGKSKSKGRNVPTRSHLGNQNGDKDKKKKKGKKGETNGSAPAEKKHHKCILM